MKTIIYAVFATLCIHSVYCQEITNIYDVIEKSVNVIGTTEKLVCIVMYPFDLNISWIKVNNENSVKPIVLTYGNKVVINDKRFSLQKDIVIRKLFNGNSYTLTISNLKISDSGSYLCQVLLQSNNVIFTNREIEVRKPTHPTIIKNMTSFTVVMKGRPLKLECYASGFPIPKIYWIRENSEILFTGELYHRGNILEIPTIKKEDRGNYYCIAENGIMPSPRRKIGVIVEFLPVVTTSKQLHGQALNDLVALDCHIEACPPPIVIWVFEGIPVNNNKYYTISNIVTSSKEIVDSKLHININEQHMYGDYICRAFNVFGAAEVTINLYENTITE